MDKIDIIGHGVDDMKSKTMIHEKHTDDLSSNKHFKVASEFALFVRNQTKKNSHLNLCKIVFFHILINIFIDSKESQINDKNLSSKIIRFDKFNKEEIISILIKSIIRITGMLFLIKIPI